jgi:hypothetical protein
MAEVRIVKVVSCGVTWYQIQKFIRYPFWPFKKQWVNAWLDDSLGAACQDSFFSLDEAKAALPYFRGEKPNFEVVQ